MWLQTCVCAKDYAKVVGSNGEVQCVLSNSVSWVTIVIPVVTGLLAVFALGVAGFFWANSRNNNAAAYKRKGPPGQPLQPSCCHLGILAQHSRCAMSWAIRWSVMQSSNASHSDCDSIAYACCSASGIIMLCRTQLRAALTDVSTYERSWRSTKQ